MAMHAAAPGSSLFVLLHPPRLRPRSSNRIAVGAAASSLGGSDRRRAISSSSSHAAVAMTTSPDEIVQARVELWNLTFGYLKSMALDCAVRLGIPNAIHSHGGAASLSDLVAALAPAVPPHRKPYLPRLLRFLAATGILLADDDTSTTTYRLTPMSRLLVDDAAVNGCTSLSPWVLSQTTRYHVAAAQHLPEWFLGGDGAAAVETPFRMAYGGIGGPWDAARSDPRFNEVFNAGMEADSHLALEFAIAGCGEALFAGVSSLVDVAGGTGGAAKAIARAFPHVKCSVLDLPHVISTIALEFAIAGCGEALFAGVSSLVDVAGGTGGAAKAIARAFPHVKCSVLDLPHVISTIMRPPADADDATLVEYIPGDMMEYIPPTDAVFLKYVMHDWSDEVCVKILRQCKKAICSQKPNGGGKERDEQEWRKIFTEAGFRHYEAKPLLGFMSIIELYP